MTIVQNVDSLCDLFYIWKYKGLYRRNPHNAQMHERSKTMTIKQANTGAHGRKTRYFIENEGGETVAHFDSLCTAALVLRYLNGAPMTEEDADMAWDAMQAFDTRNEGKRH